MALRVMENLSLTTYLTITTQRLAGPARQTGAGPQTGCTFTTKR